MNDVPTNAIDDDSTSESEQVFCDDNDCKKHEKAILKRAAAFLNEDSLGEGRVHKVIELNGHFALVQLIPIVHIGAIQLYWHNKIVERKNNPDSSSKFQFQIHFVPFFLKMGEIIREHFKAEGIEAEWKTWRNDSMWLNL